MDDLIFNKSRRDPYCLLPSPHSSGKHRHGKQLPKDTMGPSLPPGIVGQYQSIRANGVETTEDKSPVSMSGNHDTGTSCGETDQLRLGWVNQGLCNLGDRVWVATSQDGQRKLAGGHTYRRCLISKGRSSRNLGASSTGYYREEGSSGYNLIKAL